MRGDNCGDWVIQLAQLIGRSGRCRGIDVPLPRSGSRPGIAAQKTKGQELWFIPVLFREGAGIY